MKKLQTILSLGAVAVPAIIILTGSKTAADSKATAQLARGKYLVSFGGCNDCHTPLKMTDKGPVPDISRQLSGHPQETQCLRRT